MQIRTKTQVPILIQDTSRLVQKLNKQYPSKSFCIDIETWAFNSGNKPEALYKLWDGVTHHHFKTWPELVEYCKNYKIGG